MACASWPLLQCAWLGLAVIAFGAITFFCLALVAMNKSDDEDER